MSGTVRANSGTEREGSVKISMMTLVADDRGQDLIEYALLAGFVSLVVVATVTNLGTSVNTLYTSVNTQVGLIPTP